MVTAAWERSLRAYGRRHLVPSRLSATQLRKKTRKTRTTSSSASRSELRAGATRQAAQTAQAPRDALLSRCWVLAAVRVGSVPPVAHWVLLRTELIVPGKSQLFACVRACVQRG